MGQQLEKAGSLYGSALTLSALQLYDCDKPAFEALLAAGASASTLPLEVRRGGTRRESTPCPCLLRAL